MTNERTPVPQKLPAGQANREPKNCIYVGIAAVLLPLFTLECFVVNALIEDLGILLFIPVALGPIVALWAIILGRRCLRAKKAAHGLITLLLGIVGMGMNLAILIPLPL